MLSKDNLEDAREADPHENGLFLVLEGGGAKGVAHVAAWSILQPALLFPRDFPSSEQLRGEYPPFLLRGVAGTSAGAIMAAFIAAGAKPTDLVDKGGNLPLTSELGLTHFYDLFGMKGWRWLKFLRFLLQPSRRLSQIAARLKPKRFRPSEPAPLQDSWDYVERLLPLNPFVWFLSLVVAGALVFVALDKWMFDNPTIAAIDLVCFWFVQRACFAGTNSWLRKIERRRVLAKRRHFSRWMRFWFHPLTVVGYAILLTVAITQFVFPWLGLAHGAQSHSDPREITFLLYGLFGALVGLSLIGGIRRFLKGTIDTGEIRRDLNTVLTTILTKSSQLNEGTGKYVWTAKTPQSEAEELLLKSFAANPDRDVTFKDLFEATGIPLTLVAADVIANAVHVYSTDTHPNFSVARAVSASLAIPFAFRPVRDGMRILVDGGIVSSIPAWLYRRHRSLDPDARILAVGIAAPDYETWLPYFLSARRRKIAQWQRKKLGLVGKTLILAGQFTASTIWPLRVVANIGSTTAYGARVLELDASDRLDSFELRPRLGLLDFDFGHEHLKGEIEHLKKEARFYITNLLWGRKKAFTQTCETIAAEFWKRAPTEDPRARIRMFWAERDGRADAMRIKATYGFDEDDLDDRLVLSYRSSMTGWAAETGQSQFGDKRALTEMLATRMNRYRRAVKWAELEWCWAVPIVDPKTNVVKGVVAIESNRSLGFFDRGLAEQAFERANAWLTEDEKLRTSSDAIQRGNLARAQAPAMTTLESVWAQFVWENYAGSNLFVTSTPTVESPK
jgi:predicted acylesterase/phospholipase RssA